MAQVVETVTKKEGKRVNVETMETLTPEKNQRLVEALEKLDGFKFFIQSQMAIYRD